MAYEARSAALCRRHRWLGCIPSLTSTVDGAAQYSVGQEHGDYAHAKVAAVRARVQTRAALADTLCMYIKELAVFGLSTVEMVHDLSFVQHGRSPYRSASKCVALPPLSCPFL